MKKIIACLLLLCITTFSGCGKSEAAEKKFDFRNTNWGMSMEEVKTAETIELSDSTDNYYFYYNVPVADILSSELIYTFDNGKLTAAMYVSEKTKDGATLSYNEYETVRNGLLKVYGTAKEDNSDSYSPSCSWANGNTNILLWFKTDKTILISYSDNTIETTTAKNSTDGL